MQISRTPISLIQEKKKSVCITRVRTSDSSFSDNVVANLQKQIDEAKTAQHTIISNKTATDLGITPKSSTDAALQNLSMVISMIKLNKGGINLTVLSSGGNPVPGVRVSGILDVNGNEIETDSNGKLSGYMNEGSVTLAITDYADIVDYSETITVVKGNIIDKTITVTVRNFLKITSSKSVKFSGNVRTIDFSVVGGGGGGSMPTGSNTSSGSGAGGGGGECKNTTGAEISPNTSYPAVVGAGGKGSTKFSVDGADGGTSSFMGVTAAGGKGGARDLNGNRIGGAGNGKGGDGRFSNGVNPGGDGAVYGFKSFTETAKFGGGGSGGPYGYNTNRPDGRGGADFGADKGDAEANTGGGGAGGWWQYIDDVIWDYPGSGGSGVVTVRMHLKNAA